MAELSSVLLRGASILFKSLYKKEFRKNDTLVIDLFDIDTFVIFLSPPRNEDTQLLHYVETIVERIRISIKNEIFNILYPCFKVYSGPSIGYSMVSRNSMLSNMRQIMQLVIRDKKTGEFLREKQSYEDKYLLQKIIIQKNIYTVFQPIVNFEKLQVIGYEALSRGPKNTEFNSPLFLFTFASECGLSFELDSLCRGKAFSSIRTLKTDKKIFVNALPMTIHDPEFRGVYLKKLLKDIKVKPENVVFEINEKLAIDNYDIFRKAMKDYADIGIVHASDDIGTGYSDLERIMELNPGFLKIDISLIRDIDKSFIKQEIIKAMVNLAKGIGSQIIAEGVETKEEYIKLKELGIRLWSGVFICQAVRKFG